MTGPSSALVARLATAWRQLARVREDDRRVTSASAAAAAAQAAGRVDMLGISSTGAVRAPAREVNRGPHER